MVSEEYASWTFQGFARQKHVLNNGTRLRDITAPKSLENSGRFRGDFCTGPVPLINS